MNRNKKLLIALVLILLVILIVVPRLGTFLVLDHDLEEADLVVVLMGSVPDRSLEAVDLYEQGFADEMILVQSYQTAGDLLAEKGIELPGQAELTRMVAVELGVPEEKITILPGEARSTRDEALVIKDYLEQDTGIDSLILVTSSYHTRRAYAIFNRVLADLEKELTLKSRGSRYDAFEPGRWWRDRESAKMVVLEYLKLLYFYGWEQFK